MGASEDHLERDEPVELRLPSLVHNSHAATAQLAEYLVTDDLRDFHDPPYPRPRLREMNGVGRGERAASDGSMMVAAGSTGGSG